jgi:hypothetical protein
MECYLYRRYSNWRWGRGDRYDWPEYFGINVSIDKYPNIFRNLWIRNWYYSQYICWWKRCANYCSPTHCAFWSPTELYSSNLFRD